MKHIGYLRENWIFPISAFAFFCLQMKLTTGYICGMFLATVVIGLFSMRISGIKEKISSGSCSVNVFSLITALGICVNSGNYFYKTFWPASKVQQAADKLSVSKEFLLTTVACCLGVTAFTVVFVVLALFFQYLSKVITEVYAKLEKTEKWVYLMIVVSLMILATWAFMHSEIFYGTKNWYDVIYTSDSLALIKGNAYLLLTHGENDLRQPLFAAYASPFLGAVYLLSMILRLSAMGRALLMDLVQIFLLVAANYFLAEILGLKAKKRICFMLLINTLYSTILASIMMEQYVIAYFWLMLFLYSCCVKKKSDKTALYGAGGTLLTSFLLTPLAMKRSLLREPGKWLLDMGKTGLGFLLLLIAFARAEIIFSLPDKISTLLKFTGARSSFGEKAEQYLSFIRSCFLAPEAGADFTTYEHVSWQLEKVSGISITGISILLLAVLGFCLNYKKTSSQIAMAWCGFSFVMLCLVGWGTAENGLILYSLYFGWAFFVLLFQLVERVGVMLKIKYMLPVLTVVCTVFFLFANMKGILELLKFAIRYYPVALS